VVYEKVSHEVTPMGPWFQEGLREGIEKTFSDQHDTEHLGAALSQLTPLQGILKTIGINLNVFTECSQDKVS
jgi:hypothetical protein